MQTIKIIGAANDFGASKYGARLAPKTLRDLGLCEQLVALGYTVSDYGDVLPQISTETQPRLKNWQTVADFNKRLHHAVNDSFDKKQFPLVLGGDHSISAGTVSAAAKHHEGLGVIWVDAHGDWNNQLSTPSGNMHGMSYSAVCGGGPDCMARFDDDFVAVDARRCVLIGGRDIDRDELPRMLKNKVTIFTSDEVNRVGIEKIAKQALDIATSDGNYYLSFDVDVMSPEYAPGTGTTAPKGLTDTQAIELAELLSCPQMVGLDLVEINPTLDVCNKTSTTAIKIILNALKNIC